MIEVKIPGRWLSACALHWIEVIEEAELPARALVAVARLPTASPRGTCR